MSIQNSRTFQPQNGKKDPLQIIKKYLNLLILRKYWIIASTIFFGVVGFLLFSYVIKPVPEFSASAVLKFEDESRYSGRVGAVTDFAQMRNESKLAILSTKPFLERVIDSLNYNLILGPSEVSRSELFKKINIRKKDANYGIYDVVVQKNSIFIFFSNKKMNLENELINEFPVTPDSVIFLNLNGIDLVVNQSILLREKKITFDVIPDRGATYRLNSRLEYSLDRRTNTLLTITYKDNNPKFAAEVTNSVAKLFIDQLLDFKRFRTRSVLGSLESQLKVAQLELHNSEGALRRFREQNPFLFLSSSDQTIVSELSNDQQDLYSAKQNNQTLISLIETKNNESDEDRTLVYQEIISFLISMNYSGITVLDQRYRGLITEKNNLLSANYSPQHPMVADLNVQISELESEINQRAQQYINQLNSHINNLEGEINSTQNNLRRLPRNELRLAELQRDKDVKENIYSNILIRFNEAKVSDAAIIPDAYVIDPAEPPRVFGPDIIDLVFQIIGFILGFVLAAGVIIGMDFLDKSVKEPESIQNMLHVPVLAVLPVIGEEKDIPDIIDSKKKFDPKLITSDYAPHLAGESFRLLRTKILMDGSHDQSSLIIASLNPGEGKSLVSANLAITFAQQKIPTLMIDCDMRRGVLHNTFAADKKPGIADILIGNKPVSMPELSNVVQKTHIPNLFLLSSGTQVPNPSELLGSSRMREVYYTLKKEFGVIIFDTPPIDFIPDALVINNFIHRLILVARYGKTNLSKLNQKVQEFDHLRQDLDGVVINASSEVKSSKYYSYSYYQY